MKNNSDIIFERKFGLYRKIDLDSVWDDDKEILNSLGKELISLGYESIGDLMCSLYPQTPARCFANRAKGIYASIFAAMHEGKFVVVTLDLDSRFIDGSSLTSTVFEHAKSYPEKGIYKCVYGWQGVQALHDHHERRLNEIRNEFGRPLPVGADLLSMAKGWDQYFAVAVKESVSA